MKRISPLRNKLIISIFIGCLVPYIIGGFYLKDFMQKWLYQDNLDQTNQLLFQIAENIDHSVIQNVSESVKMLSENNLVKQADSSINNYTAYDKIHFQKSKSEVENNISNLFGDVYISHLPYSFIFLGTSTGGYIEYPQFKLNSSYDPTQRPWYKSTIVDNQIHISDPYITKITKEMIMSFTKKVISSDGHDIGVVGVAVKIEDLTQRIGSIRIGTSGYIIVLNSNDKIVISPKNSEWVLKTPEDLNNTMLTELPSKVGKAYEAVLDGEAKVMNTYISPDNGWKVVSIVNKKEVVGKSHEMTNILLMIYTLTLLIILAVVVFISSRITEPILRISKVIDRMAAFDVKYYTENGVESYLDKKDEIGIISNALAGMQGNFVELNRSIQEMDEEIRNIDVQKDTKVRLSLSDNNPFNGVTKSFNALLEKVHTYFDQLKDSNREINEKNELLMTSEEELMAQLEEIETQKEYINFLAYHDPLTELPNRRYFIEELEHALLGNESGAVILIDLDNFKSINDTMGHVYGDKVLTAVSKSLEVLISDNVFVSRFGGDEFLILLKNEGNYNQVKLFVQKIWNIFEEKLPIDGNEVQIAFSMGISFFPHDSSEVNQLIMNADLALYEVKNLGKNGYKFFESSMTDHLLRKAYIGEIIVEALETDGFKMVYQPQVNLLNGEVQAYEALLRLKNHKLSPAEFIPICEENGTIVKIGRIVTQKVVEQLGEWQKKGYHIRPVSINFSATQLHDRGYFRFIMNELEKNMVDPKFIEIEITENIFLENKEQTLAFLVKLRDAGMKISIDDFGTGYSSLSYLTFLPIDKIKLDRSLNNKFLEIENIRVMDSLILLAHSLNLEVVAEGIETKDQFKRLRVGKCDFIQGYYFSKPLEVEAVEKNFGANYYENADLMR